MNKRFHKVILAAVLCVLAGGCRNNIQIEIDSEEKALFLKNERIGIYSDGNGEFLYRPTCTQISRNDARRKFRLQTNAQDTCVMASLDKNPGGLGATVLVNIQYVVPNGVDSFIIDMECSTSEGGKRWLWAKLNKIGLIMPVLQ